jgi:hypothetical protein
MLALSSPVPTRNEVHTLRSVVSYATCPDAQAYDRRESDLQELQAQVAAAELLLSQVRAEGSAALLALREQLSEAHEQDRELLMRELRELQVRPCGHSEVCKRAAPRGLWMVRCVTR